MCEISFKPIQVSSQARSDTYTQTNIETYRNFRCMYVVLNGRRVPGGASAAAVSDSPPDRTMGNGNGTRSRNGAKVQPEPVTSSLRLTCYFLTLSSRHGRAAPGNNVSSTQPRSRDCFLVLDNGVGDRAANRVRQSRQDLARRVWNSQEPEERLANNH